MYVKLKDILNPGKVSFTTTYVHISGKLKN